MHIRPATPEDFDTMIGMGYDLLTESPRYSGMEYDGEKINRLLTLITNGIVGAAFVVVDEKVSNDTLAGLTIVVETDRWFGPGTFATDLTLYVRPEYRRSGAFDLLVDAIEGWAEGRGVRDVALGVSTEVHPQETVRAYEKKGYKVTGYTLTKVLETDHGD